MSVPALVEFVHPTGLAWPSGLPPIEAERDDSRAAATDAAAPCRVVIVDDDRTCLRSFELLLRKENFEVTTATTVRAALDSARRGFDVMLLDVRLGAEDGLDVLRALRSEGIPGHVVVITGFDTEGVETEATRLGGEFVDRWTMPDVVQLVRRAMRRTRSEEHENNAPVITPPVLTRWAEAVARAVSAPDDPTSIDSWAHAIGKSAGSLRALCELAEISPKKSCTLVRVLRAAHLSTVSGRMNGSEWLIVADARTLKHLLAESGLSDGFTSIQDVLRHQRLVTNHTAIALLRRALREHRLF